VTTPFYIVSTPDGVRVQFSTAAACLAAVRRGGCRLVQGDPADLLALAYAEQDALWLALRPEGGRPCESPGAPAK